MIHTGIRHFGGIHAKPIPWEKAMDIFNMLMVDPEKNYRRLFAYAFGLFTGARAGEVSAITWGDIYGVNETARGNTNLRITFQSLKGSMKRYPHLSPELIEAIIKVKEWAEPHVMRSARPVIIHPTSNRVEVTSGTAAKLVNSALVIGGVFDTSGVHTLRKTLGRKMYEFHGKTDEAIHIVQKFLGHKDRNSTMCYIGITDEKIKHTIQNLNAQGVLIGEESFFDILGRNARGAERIDSDQSRNREDYLLRIS